MSFTNPLRIEITWSIYLLICICSLLILLIFSHIIQKKSEINIENTDTIYAQY